MFFLMGSPRSGTTILAQCISSHPDVIIPDETDFIVPLAFLCDRIKDEKIGRDLVSDLIVNTERFKYSIGEYLSKEEVIECVRHSHYSPASILDSIYSQIAAVAGKRLAGDKSPNDLLSVRSLFTSGTLNPDTKIIHIVRDVRDVMVSLNKTGWQSDLDEYFPRMWCSTNLYLKYERQEDANYLLVRYEEFVQNPASALRSVCGLLGIDYTDEMLKTENRNARYQEVSHHSNIYNPVNDSSVGAFKKKLSAETLRRYDSQALEALIEFGYVGREPHLEKSRRILDKLFGKAG